MTDFDLPGALLVTGGQGIDIVTTAHHLVPKDSVILEVKEHKKETGTTIGIFIDDIRDLQRAVRSKSAQTIVVIVNDAAKMNPQAQNAFLKLLEEPRAGLHFILVTHTPEVLLATVRSRCQAYTVDDTSEAVDLPADKRARIVFMAAGNKTVERQLAQDDKLYTRYAALFENAKVLLAGEALAKLKLISTVRENRTEAHDLLAASMTMARQMLQQRYSPELVARLDKLLAADEAIAQNGNVRLQLLASVI